MVSLLLATFFFFPLRHQFPFRSICGATEGKHTLIQCWICMIKCCKLKERYILLLLFNRDEGAEKVSPFCEFTAFYLSFSALFLIAQRKLKIALVIYIRSLLAIFVKSWEIMTSLSKFHMGFIICFDGFHKSLALNAF